MPLSMRRLTATQAPRTVSNASRSHPRDHILASYWLMISPPAFLQTFRHSPPFRLFVVPLPSALQVCLFFLGLWLHQRFVSPQGPPFYGHYRRLLPCDVF